VVLDVLEQGREPERPTRDGRRRASLAVAAVALLVAAVLVGRGTPAPEPSPSAAPLLRPLPRVLLERATVVRGREAEDGVLELQVGVEGVPRAQLLSLDVELPGSAVVLAPLPDRLSGDGTAVLDLEVLPQCPQARAGLTRAALTGVVRGREGARVRSVRVRLDTAGFLDDVVRERCGAVPGVPELRTSLVQRAGPAGAEVLSTRVDVAPAGDEPVTVVAVHPGPGLSAQVRTPLPLSLAPGSAAVPLVVDLQPGGCGGAPDTPPYVLVLSTGQTLAPSVGPAVQPLLDRLRPYQCAG
jgi:hypothetical protein